MLDNHANQEQAELSYFYLNLLSYLYDFHPDKVSETYFITERGDEAADAYSEAIKNGMNHIQAGEIAYEVLFHGLHFSPFSVICEILANEFSQEIPSENIREKAMVLLPQCQHVFSKYMTDDNFVQSANYQLFYTELTGTIQILQEYGI